MSLKTTILLITFASFFLKSYSQNTIEKNGDPGTFFPKYAGEKKWKMIFALDARRSFLHEQQIKINGIRVGAAHNGVSRFGLGFYTLKNKINIDGLAEEVPDAHDEPNSRVTFSFTTFFYEKVFYKSKRWEISLPASHGIGSLNSEYRNNLGNYKKLKNDSFSVMSLGVNTNFYILPWLYPRVMIGYRFAFNADEKIRQSFTKPIYALGISLNPLGAYKSYKTWKTEKQEKPITQ